MTHAQSRTTHVWRMHCYCLLSLLPAISAAALKTTRRFFFFLFYYFFFGFIFPPHGLLWPVRRRFWLLLHVNLLETNTPGPGLNIYHTVLLFPIFKADPGWKCPLFLFLFCYVLGRRAGRVMCAMNYQIKVQTKPWLCGWLASLCPRQQLGYHSRGGSQDWRLTILRAATQRHSEQTILNPDALCYRLRNLWEFLPLC